MIWKKLIASVWEPTAVPEKKEAKTPQTINQPVVVTVPEVSVRKHVSENINEYLEGIRQTIKQHNDTVLPGNDYYEFIVMKNAIGASIPIESARYTATFAGMASTGLDKAKLLTTAEQYIAVIDSEEKLFETEYNEQYAEKVTSIEMDIAEKNAKLEELSKQMGTISQEVATLKNSSSQAAIQLRSKKDAFTQAASVVKEEIKSEIQKINTYIN